jgi:hypothetical protein
MPSWQGLPPTPPVRDWTSLYAKLTLIITPRDRRTPFTGWFYGTST